LVENQGLSAVGQQEAQMAEVFWPADAWLTDRYSVLPGTR
jgi:hypothetical protein